MHHPLAPEQKALSVQADTAFRITGYEGSRRIHSASRRPCPEPLQVSLANQTPLPPSSIRMKSCYLPPAGPRKGKWTQRTQPLGQACAPTIRFTKVVSLHQAPPGPLSLPPPFYPWRRMVLSAAGLTLWPSPNCACRKTRLDLCHCYTLSGLPQPCLSSPHQHQLGSLASLVSLRLLSLHLWSRHSVSYIQLLFSDPNRRLRRCEGKVF